MKLVIKVLSLLGAVGVFIFSFFVFSQFLSSNWLNWVWAIVTLILIIANFFFIYAEYDDGSNDKSIHMVQIICQALVTASLVCKCLTCETGNEGFFLLPILLYFLFCGINRFMLSFLLLGAGITFFLSNIDFGTWHSYTLFVISIIAYVFITVGYGIDMCTDEYYNFNYIGYIITPILIAYAFLSGTNMLSTDYQILFLLGFILLSFALSMDNNIAVYAISPVIVTIYGQIVMFEWHHIYSWIIITVSIIFALFFYFSYKSYRGAVRYIFAEYVNNINDYNALVKEYNALASSYNAQRGASNYGGHRGSSWSDNIITGFFRGLGSILAGDIFG